MHPRNERGSARTAPIAIGLAVVAVVVVLAAAVVTTIAVRDDPGGEASGAGSDPGSQEPTPDPSTDDTDDTEEEVDSFFPDGQVITGDRRDNANVEIPSTDEGWEATSSDYVIGYLGRDGLAEVGVTGPYRWRAGPCGSEEDDQRAWVGFTGPSTDDGEDDVARRSVETVAEAFERTISRDPTTTSITPIETASTTISDGSDAATASFVFESTGEGGGECVAPAIELRFLSFDTGDFAANLVLQRGVRRDGSDAPGHLDADTAEAILASARRQQDS